MTITRIKAYWDERTEPAGWSWQEWSGNDLIDSGGCAAEDHDSAADLVIERAYFAGIDLQDADVAQHPTEDGGWAEWQSIQSSIYATEL